MQLLYRISLITLLSFVYINGYSATTDNDWGIDNIPMQASYSKDSLKFSSKDDRFEINLHTYIQTDVMKFTGDTRDLNSGANIRRARVSLFGKFLTNWIYNFTYDFAEGGSLIYANGGYDDGKHNQIIVGQFLPNFSISNWDSSFALNFLELAPVVDIFSPDYGIGTSYSFYTGTFALHASVFGPNANQSVKGRNPIGSSIRIIYAPIHTETKVFELGVSASTQKPDGSNKVMFNSMPDVKSRNADTLISATVSNVDNYGVIGPEISAVYKAFSLQGEYYVTRLNRMHGSQDVNFSGFYGTIGYFLTGESRLYSYPGGGFVDITPIKHRFGAWQIMGRYDYLDLNDKDIQAGKQQDLTIGLNWFINQFVVFQLNYVRAFANNIANQDNKKSNVFAARMQVRF